MAGAGTVIRAGALAGAGKEAAVRLAARAAAAEGGGGEGGGWGSPTCLHFFLQEGPRHFQDRRQEKGRGASKACTDKKESKMAVSAANHVAEVRSFLQSLGAPPRVQIQAAPRVGPAAAPASAPSTQLPNPLPKPPPRPRAHPGAAAAAAAAAASLSPVFEHGDEDESQPRLSPPVPSSTLAPLSGSLPQHATEVAPPSLPLPQAPPFAPSRPSPAAEPPSSSGAAIRRRRDLSVGIHGRASCGGGQSGGSRGGGNRGVSGRAESGRTTAQQVTTTKVDRRVAEQRALALAARKGATIAAAEAAVREQRLSSAAASAATGGSKWLRTKKSRFGVTQPAELSRGVSLFSGDAVTIFRWGFIGGTWPSRAGDSHRKIAPNRARRKAKDRPPRYRKRNNRSRRGPMFSVVLFYGLGCFARTAV